MRGLKLRPSKRHSEAIPIFKIGQPDRINNYSNFSTSFETILRNRILLSLCGLISSAHHGFVKEKVNGYQTHSNYLIHIRSFGLQQTD